MNILIIDIDSEIRNFALAKIDLFHRKQGHTILWNLELARDWADQIYVSCIFSKNKDQCLEWEGFARIGGSGYDLQMKLPAEIQVIKPRINLGFTTRGCSRKCPFCIVPQKEGSFHVVGDLLDLWDFKSCDITLLDNNILVDVDHFKLVCEQARAEGLQIDFNQGLDHRLLTPEVVHELKTVRCKEYRFAFDNPNDLDTVEHALDLLSKGGINQSFWYILVGYNTMFDQDLMRLNFLRAQKQAVFVQRYKETRGNLLVAQWGNQHGVFAAMTFWEFLQIERYKRYRAKYAGEIEPYFQNYTM